MTNTTSTGSATAIGRLEVRLRDMSQLFESLDPSPFHDKDLDRNAEEYIIDSARELHSKSAYELVIHVDNSPGHPDEERAAGDAIRAHFARRSRLQHRKLRQLLRRGVLSLAIALAFLVLLFVTAQFTGLASAESGAARLVRESMLIVGWVAMWRPLEVFLYDWWPIAGERRLSDQLSRIDVQVARGAGMRPMDPHPGSSRGAAPDSR